MRNDTKNGAAAPSPRKRYLSEAEIEQFRNQFVEHLITEEADLPSYWLNVGKRRTVDALLRDAVRGCIFGGSTGRNNIEVNLCIRRAYQATLKALKRAGATQAESAAALALLCCNLDYSAMRRGGEYAAAVLGPRKQRRASTKN